MDSRKNWQSVGESAAKNYKCGYSDCGREVSSERGWSHQRDDDGHADGLIQICSVCKRPTFFDLALGVQTPGVSLGNDVGNLPPDISAIWSEIRTATSHNAYTSAVLTGRKLLMHIAVSQGAAAGLTFVQYVDYLVNNHFAPPNSAQWIDRIRTHGNEANHQIVVKARPDAEEIITFLEMLLRFIYEFPARGAVTP